MDDNQQFWHVLATLLNIPLFPSLPPLPPGVPGGGLCLVPGGGGLVQGHGGEQDPVRQALYSGRWGRCQGPCGALHGEGEDWGHEVIPCPHTHIHDICRNARMPVNVSPD